MKIKSLFTRLLKQRNMSPIIGAMINAYSSTSILFSPLTLMGVATTVYGLWGGEILRRIFPWFSTWMLFCAIIILVLIAMIIFYKVVIPSQYAFTVQQYYKHRNPMVTDINQSLENDKLILSILGKIEKTELETKTEIENIKKRLDVLEKK